MRVACRARDSLRNFSVRVDRSCATPIRHTRCSFSDANTGTAPVCSQSINRRSSGSAVRVSLGEEVNYAAVDVQRAGAARRPERSVPDEHLLRRAAAGVVRRHAAAGPDRRAATPRSTTKSARRSRRWSRTASSSRAATDERAALDEYFADLREDTEQLRVTVLTTLQCNFACDYCFQGDHGDYNKFAEKMSLETAAKVVAWIESRLDEVRPRSSC